MGLPDGYHKGYGGFEAWGWHGSAPPVSWVEMFQELWARESLQDKIGWPLSTSAWLARLPGQRVDDSSAGMGQFFFHYFQQQMANQLVGQESTHLKCKMISLRVKEFYFLK